MDGRLVRMRDLNLGAVLTTDWIILPSGKQCRVFIGQVRVVKDTAALGWEMQGRDSNWIATISGKGSSVHIPGCQVSAVMEFRDPTAGLGDLDGAYVVP